MVESEAGLVRYGLADQRNLAVTNSALALALTQNLGALVDASVLTDKSRRLPKINLLGSTGGTAGGKLP